jgi:hypothetical protein
MMRGGFSDRFSYAFIANPRPGEKSEVVAHTVDEACGSEVGSCYRVSS